MFDDLLPSHSPSHAFPLLLSVAGKAVLVKRGGCMFVDKAKTAQAAGAKLVMVMNTGRTSE